jgi:imidazolonepropionase-like amidohydrolase
MGYIALLRQTLYDAQAYLAAKPEKKDPDLEELGKVFSGTAVVAADTIPDITRALRLAGEFNLKMFVSGGRNAFQMLPELSGVPVLASISIGTEPAVRPTPDGAPAEVLEERRAAWKERSMNVIKLVEAGAKVAFSSDGDGAGSYLANVRKLISMGLKREDALKAMTTTPASLFGMSDWGSIKKGGVANLVVMDGDFASESSKVKMVFVNGKKFEVTK